MGGAARLSLSLCVCVFGARLLRYVVVISRVIAQLLRFLAEVLQRFYGFILLFAVGVL